MGKIITPIKWNNRGCDSCREKRFTAYIQINQEKK